MIIFTANYTRAWDLNFYLQNKSMINKTSHYQIGSSPQPSGIYRLYGFCRTRDDWVIDNNGLRRSKIRQFHNTGNSLWYSALVHYNIPKAKYIISMTILFPWDLMIQTLIFLKSTRGSIKNLINFNSNCFSNNFSLMFGFGYQCSGENVKSTTRKNAKYKRTSNRNSSCCYCILNRLHTCHVLIAYVCLT